MFEDLITEGKTTSGTKQKPLRPKPNVAPIEQQNNHGITCPFCYSSNLKFFDTHRNGESGRYKCKNCGYNGVWRLFDKALGLYRW